MKKITDFLTKAVGLCVIFGLFFLLCLPPFGVMLLAVALGLSFPLVLLIGGSALLIAAPVATVTRGVRSGFRHLHKG